MTNGEDALSCLRAAAAKAVQESNAKGNLEASRMALVFEGIIAEAIIEAAKKFDEDDYSEGCPNCSCAG